MEHTRRKKIAYYTLNDPLDKRSWSGITYYLGKALQKNIGEVHYLGPVKIPWMIDKFFRAIQKLTRSIFGTEWIPKYSLLQSVYAAYVLKKRMRDREYDFLFAPSAAPELAYMDTKLPIIYFGDATFKLYSEAYKKEFKKLNALSRWEGGHLEKRALQKSKLVIMTSQWAADSAVNDYDVSQTKLEILLLGANIDQVPEERVIFNKEANRTLTLLFLAVDWERKGGDIAFDTLKHLEQLGIKTELIICGCVPPAGFFHPCMQVIPFINKNNPDEYLDFVHMMSNVHFLILPTRADCSLLVAMEANAYGVPAITSRVGGVPDVVKDGINGYCLPVDADGEVYAHTIADIFADKSCYKELIASSRKRFEEDLNWDIFAQKFSEILKKREL